MKLKGKVYKTVVRHALLYGADTWATTRGQEARLDVNEMRMQRWMCGVTRRDKIRNKHIRGTDNKSGGSMQENYKTTTEVVRQCEKNERGAHSETNVGRCVHTGEKKKRTAKPTTERCIQERHDKGGYERGRHDKQASLMNKDHQLYRQPQMMGQAREEEEEDITTMEPVTWRCAQGGLNTH